MLSSIRIRFIRKRLFGNESSFVLHLDQDTVILNSLKSVKINNLISTLYTTR